MRYSILFILICLSGQVGHCQKVEYLKDMWGKLARDKDTLRVKDLLSIGAYYLNENHYDSTQHYLEQALNLSKQLRFNKGIRTALSNLGVFHFRHSRYAQALDCYEQTVEMAKATNSLREAALATSNIAEVNIMLGNYEKGFRQFNESEAILVNLKDTGDLASLHIRMSQLYSNKKDTAQSNFYLEKALAECQSLLANPALPLLEKIRQESLLRAITFTRCELFKNKKEYAKALALGQQLLLDMEATPGGREKIVYAYKVAEIYYEMGQHPIALQKVNNAFAYLQKDSIPDLYAFAYELRANIYRAMGQPAKALEDFTTWKQIQDSVFNRDMINQSYILLAKQETERKNEQISHLNKQKRLYKILGAIAALAALGTGLALLMLYRSRKLQRKLLQQQNQILQNEKELETNRLKLQLFDLEQSALRAQMNPHFIFNSLNSIQHYVINRDIQGANKYISMLGSLIRLTLEHAAKPTISLKEELVYLEKYLELEKMRMQDDFDYRITLAPGLRPEAHSILPMLLQPFLENAIKHGIGYLKDRRGLVELAIAPFKGGLQYTITDNGVGRGLTGQFKKMAKEPAHQPKGIQLSEKRIEQLKKGGAEATLTITDLSDSEGNPSGTQVVIVVAGKNS